MASQVRVVVVGLGHWGPNIVRALDAHPMGKVVAAVEPSSERTAIVREKLPVLPIYSSFEECLSKESFEAVVVAVPTIYHHQVAMQALHAGKHILVEKPLAHSSQAASELIEEADRRNLVLMTGHIFLFNNAVVAMKRVVDRGDLGPLLYIRSLRTNLGPIRSDVNSLWDLASHDISIFNYIFDSLPIQVSCTGFSPLGLKCEDIAQAALIYPNNQVATLFVSWLDPQKRREITVVGEKRMLIFDDMTPEQPIRIFDKGVQLHRPDEYVDSFHSFRLAIRDGNVSKPEVSTGEPLKQECAHFIDCVVSGQRPSTDGPGGLAVVRVLEALTKSMSAGGRPELLWEAKSKSLQAVAGGVK